MEYFKHIAPVKGEDEISRVFGQFDLLQSEVHRLYNMKKEEVNSELVTHRRKLFESLLSTASYLNLLVTNQIDKTTPEEEITSPQGRERLKHISSTALFDESNPEDAVMTLRERKKLEQIRKITENVLNQAFQHISVDKLNWLKGAIEQMVREIDKMMGYRESDFRELVTTLKMYSQEPEFAHLELRALLREIRNVRKDPTCKNDLRDVLYNFLKSNFNIVIRKPRK